MPKMISKEVIDRILPVYKSCTSYAETADILGISVSTVGRVVRESGYDRYHVSGTVSKDVPISNEEPTCGRALSVTSRTEKIKSSVTGLVYTISTESDVMEIESDTALMQINVNLLGQFINEIKDIQSMVKIRR